VRDQLRWAAEVIAAANDQDLLNISAAGDAPTLPRRGLHRLTAAGLLPAGGRPSAARDGTGRTGRHQPWERPVTDNV